MPVSRLRKNRYKGKGAKAIKRRRLRAFKKFLAAQRPAPPTEMAIDTGAQLPVVLPPIQTIGYSEVVDEAPAADVA